MEALSNSPFFPKGSLCGTLKN